MSYVHVCDCKVARKTGKKVKGKPCYTTMVDSEDICLFCGHYAKVEDRKKLLVADNPFTLERCEDPDKTTGVWGYYDPYADWGDL